MRGTVEGQTREARILELVFRVGVAGCFIGHGAFGIIGKQAWLPYFAVAGLPESWAWALMPLVGSVDIAVGILALVSPRPAALAYMVVWAAWTALLRPLAGESAFELLERAGNYGLPLACLVAVGFSLRTVQFKDWVGRVRVDLTSERQRRRLEAVLRGTIALLLVGHGGLAVGGKALLVEHAGAAGMGPAALGWFGWGEIVLGLAILLRPTVPLLATALVLKLASETLYPFTGAPFWEFVERAGSYAAPLALMVMKTSAGRVEGRSHVVRGGVRTAVAVLAAFGISVAAASVLHQGLMAQARSAEEAVSQQDVLDGLRAGGLILACRHAHTDRSRGDQRTVDLDDPTTQRVLSDEGREQARRLGTVLRNLDVPIGDVLASPYARTFNSAELAFNKTVRTEALKFGDRREQRTERQRLLSEPTRNGNRVLMTHQGVLYSAIPGVERGSIREGDCVVVLPQGEGRFEVMGRYGPDEFRALSQVGGRLR